MSCYLVYASIVGGTVALAAGFALAEHVSSAISISLLGVLWLVAQARGIKRIVGWGFAAFVLISVLSIWAGVSPWLAFAGVTLSLAAWDLTVFSQRLIMTANEEDRRKTELAHFGRLGLVTGLALFGYFVAPRLHINLTFGAAVLLALLGIWGISALVYRLRSHE
jgi:hypothetical protein